MVVRVFLEELTKSTKNLNQESRCPGWDSNREHTELKSRVLSVD
jgi:hypothetical protein